MSLDGSWRVERLRLEGSYLSLEGREWDIQMRVRVGVGLFLCWYGCDRWRRGSREDAKGGRSGGEGSKSEWCCCIEYSGSCELSSALIFPEYVAGSLVANVNVAQLPIESRLTLRPLAAAS